MKSATLLLCCTQVMALAAPGAVATAEDRVTVLARGRVMTVATASLIEKAKFAADGCRNDYLEGYSIALMNVSAYRGRTLRIRPLGPERAFEENTQPQRRYSMLAVGEGMDCISSQTTGPLDAERRGQALEDAPKDLVISGVYLQIKAVDDEHINEHFQIELVEFD